LPRVWQSRLGCAQIVDAAHQRRALQAGAQPWIVQTALDTLDNIASSAICLLSHLWLLDRYVEMTISEMGLPELRRIADGLGYGQPATATPVGAYSLGALITLVGVPLRKARMSSTASPKKMR
jgi:hypothetical protein